MVRINQRPQLRRIGGGFSKRAVAMPARHSDGCAGAIHPWPDLLTSAHSVADAQVRAAEIAHRAQRCDAGIQLSEHVGGNHGIQHLVAELGMYKFQHRFLRAAAP